jgi:sulfur-oxidizing protein SoxY
VPISVKSTLENVSNISVFVEKNPMPLATSINLGKGSVADISVRIRMAQTSQVIALVEADGKLYRTSAQVKVTIGGCGG